MRVGGIAHQYAGPGQDFQRIECGRILDQARDGLGSRDQLRGALAVHLQGFVGVFFGEAQGALELAAGDALA
ncbi:hypothetical protein D3C87_1910690 [compost metagenome]